MSTRPVAKVAVADTTPSHRQGGTTRALLTPSSVGAISGFMGTFELEPGEFISEHYHPYSDKFVFLISGHLVVRVNGTEVTLDPDDALLITRGERNRIENRGTVRARAVFQITPLAPKPELGHVDTEAVPRPADAPPAVGGPV
ncbi:cupin domain-containing protein [Amycolatopsis anabasis]|uniref:cupin domain-containing protein n=1 Tax=Amycolatopsis anabasis TaxID=1840409 RepID=UPI00131DB0FD|nr:cupin domain-containing protein [Amycolatopsis anabasis]